MTVKELHYKFIAIHAVAAFLMVLGARELFMLLYVWVTSGAPAETTTAPGHPEAIFRQVPESYFHGIAIRGLVGLVASLLLTWVEARKRRIAKVHVLLVAVSGFLLTKVITGSFFHLHHVLPPLQDAAGVLGREALLLLNTLLLLSAAFFLIFRTRLKRRLLRNP